MFAVTRSTSLRHILAAAVFLLAASSATADTIYDDFEGSGIDPSWTLVGIGNANQQAATQDGVLALTADGATAFYGADNAGFLYREITGDFRMEVTIDGTGMITGGAYRKAGLMVRAGLDPWSERLLSMLVPYWNDSSDETHLQMVAREAYGEPGRLPIARDVIGVPRILRLAIDRVGDVFSVEYSIDGGVSWIEPTTGLGGSISIPNMPETVLVGLAMVSNNISVTSTAEFDDFFLATPEVSPCPCVGEFQLWTALFEDQFEMLSCTLIPQLPSISSVGYLLVDGERDDQGIVLANADLGKCDQNIVPGTGEFIVTTQEEAQACIDLVIEKAGQQGLTCQIFNLP